MHILTKSKQTKKIALLLLLCLMLLLSGCRKRITPSGADGSLFQEGDSAAASLELSGENLSDEQGNRDPLDTDGEADGRSDRTRENPDSPRKEYDERADAEIVPGTDHLLSREPEDGEEGSGTPLYGEGAQASRVRDGAMETATQTVAADEAEQLGVDPDAEEADSAFTYYSVLLQDRMGSLFECQRQNVYWETEEDHVTVFKTSPEHSLILDSGAYDVSARLLEENLKVDDGWVVRKNPGVIVKVVDGSVLGGSAVSSAAAEKVYLELLRRDGWSDMDAIRHGRVVLLSRELLDAPYLQLEAMLALAKTSNPDLMRDVDLTVALEMLMEEETGLLPGGIYFYLGES